MKVVRSFRYRLKPDAESEKLFWQFAGVCRLVYNLALEQRIIWGKRRRLGYNRQAAELTILRAEYDWVRRVYASCQQQALRDLDKAFTNFYSGAGFPTPRERGANDSFRYTKREFSVRSLNGKWSEVKLAKIGWVKFRATRPLPESVINVTVKHNPDGWYVSFACEIDARGAPAASAVVGIDRGVATALAFSTGQTLCLPQRLKEIEAAKRKAQRVVARRKKGSSRRRRAQLRVARLQIRQTRIRRDFNHRAALQVAREFNCAVLEKLSARAMTSTARGTVESPGKNVKQKAGLNRAIRNAGWHQFATLLAYKMEERGGQLAFVPAQFTSQTCAACGVIDARSRESQARFACVSCGHTAHADINAAINIERRWSTPLLDVEGCGYAPDEASTFSSFAVAENLCA